MKKTKVKKVIDGDTFVGSYNKFYRLADINAPERGAGNFKKAKEDLGNMIDGEYVFIKEEGQSYGRKVVTVRKPGEKMTINTKMKRKGYK